MITSRLRVLGQLVQRLITGRLGWSVMSGEESTKSDSETDISDPVVATESFPEVIRSGFERVFVLAIGLSYIRMDSGLQRSPLRTVKRFAAIILLAWWPAAINEILRGPFPSVFLESNEARVWLVLTSAVNTGMLYAAWRAWNYLAQGAPDIADLFAEQEDSRTQALWLSRWMSPLRQGAGVIGGIIVGTGFLWLVAPSLEGELEVAPFSYIAASWLTFLGANDVYWLMVMSFLPLHLKTAKLRLTWHEPAYTPGLLRLVNGYFFSGIALLLGVLAAEGLAFMIPTVEKNLVLAFARIAFPVVAGIIGIAIGIHPFLAIRRIVQQHRFQVMKTLASELHEEPRSKVDIRRADLFTRIRKSPLLPLRTAFLVEYSAAIVGSLVAYSIAQVAGQ